MPSMLMELMLCGTMMVILRSMSYCHTCAPWPIVWLPPLLLPLRCLYPTPKTKRLEVHAGAGSVTRSKRRIDILLFAVAVEEKESQLSLLSRLLPQR